MSDNPNDIILNVGYETDENSKRKVEQESQEIGRSLDNAADTDLDKKLKSAAEELEKINRGKRFDQLARDGIKAGDSIETIIRKLAEVGAETNEINKIVRSFDGLEDQINRTALAQDRLNDQFEVADRANSAIRNRLGIAGDVETGARTIAGGAELVLGRTTATQGLQAGAEVFAVVEGVGQLKVALENVKPALSTLVDQFGTKNLAFIGALGAATIALGLLSKAQNKQVELIEAELSTRRQILLEIGSLTQDEIDTRKSELTSRRAILETEIKDLNEQLQNIDLEFIDDAEIKDVFSAFGNNIKFIAQEVGLGNPEVEALRNQLEEARTELTATSSELEVLIKNTSDTKRAEEELAETRAKAIEEAKALERELAGRNIERVTEQLEALREAQELLESGSSQQAQDRLDALQDEIDSTRAYITEIEKLQQDTFEGSEAFELYREALITADGKLASLITTQETLNNALGDTLDLREQETAALQFQAKQFSQQIQDIENAIIEGISGQDFSNLTAQALQDRVDALNKEKRAIEEQLPTLEALALQSGEANQRFQQYKERIAEINGELGNLSDIALPEIRSQIFDSLAEDIGKINDAYLEKVSQINENLEKALQQAQQRLDQALQQARTTRDSDLTKAEREASQARVDAARERSEALVDLEQEIAKERSEILRRSSLEIRNAVASRDVLASFLAKQQRDEDLEQLEEREREKREQIEREYDKQIQAISEKLTEQKRIIQERYNEQVRAAYDAYNQTVQQARQQASEQIAEAQRARIESVNIRRQQANEEISILNSTYSQSASIWQLFQSNIITGLNNILTASQNFNATSALQQAASSSAVVNNSSNVNLTLQQAQVLTQQQLALQVSNEVFDIVSAVNFNLGL